MTDIFIAVGVVVSLFFVTFFIPFMVHVSSEKSLPSDEDDFIVIFIIAWVIAVMIASITLFHGFSMQKELNKYEKQEQVVERR